MSRAVRGGLLVATTLIIVLRMPDIVMHGRLWAEEGLFYQNAWFMPPLKALFWSYGGYLNIVANAGGLLARWLVPLWAAPWVTTAIGLAFQLCPAILLVTSRVQWLRSPLTMAAALLALAAPPIPEEVWLQTLHCQYQLALCVALITAFEDTPRPAVRWFRRALLLLAPLSGMLAVLLGPLMFARAVLAHSRERWVQCGLLAFGAVLQVSLYYSPAVAAAFGRPTTVWPAMLVYTLIIRHLVVPLLGPDLAQTIGDQFRWAITDGHPPRVPLLVFLILAGALGLASLRHWRSSAPWLLAAAGIVAVVSYAGAIQGGLNFLSPQWGPRYSYAPQVLIVWCLVCLSATLRARWASALAALPIVWMAAVDAADFPHGNNRSPASGADWQNEARLWRADPGHLLRIWPNGWTMQLTPDHSPIFLGTRNEGDWISGTPQPRRPD